MASGKMEAGAGRDPTGRAAARAGRTSGAGPPAGGKAQDMGRGARPGGGRARLEQAGAGAGQGGGREPAEATNATNRAGRSARAGAKTGAGGAGRRAGQGAGTHRARPSARQRGTFPKAEMEQPGFRIRSREPDPPSAEDALQASDGPVGW